MNSAQLDVTRGTRGEIAKLIGSPTRPARRTLWMPGLVPHIHSNYCYMLHTPLPYGLVPINNAARRIYRWLHGVPHICGTPWPHSCSSVPPTMQTAPLDWCNQAPSTKHCGRFFPNSSAYFTYWPLLPAFRCHNARSSLYLILYSGVKIIATFHQMNGQVIFRFYQSNIQTVPRIKYGNVPCFQGLSNAESIFWVTFS